MKLKHYRHSYTDYLRDKEIYHPLPINYIVRYWRKIRWRFLRSFRWLGLIDTPINQVFRWSDFYRIRVNK